MEEEKIRSGHWRRFVSLMMTVVLGICFLMFEPVQVRAEEPQNVRVGYYIARNFQEGGKNETSKSGYSYEYLQKIASYTGWHYEYVYGSWQELYQKLESGDIDIMAGVAYSDDRSEYISYPQYEMINETFYIYKDADDSTIKCGNIASYSGKRIGTLKNNARMTEVLENWVSENHANIEIAYYDDLAACANAFNEKKIDAFVSADNIVSSYNGIVPIEKIGKEPFYLGVTKNRQDLLDELNMALSIIDEQDSIEIDALRSKYSVESSVSVFLSKKEKDWMDTHDTITVGYTEDYLPYCDKKEDGSVTGLIADIVPDMIEALPGRYDLEVVYKGFKDQQDMIESLKKGELDLAFPVSDEAWYTEKQGYQQSSSVVSSAIDLIYEEPYSSTKTEKIAVNKNNQMQYCYTIFNYPNAKLVMCDSIADCVEAVRNGDAGSTIVSANRAHYLVGSNKKLNVSPLSNVENRCFGVAFGNSALLQIINHGLSILGENYGLNHTYPYVDNLMNYTTLDFVRDHIIGFSCSVILLLICIIAFFTKRNQNLKWAAEREAEQKQQLEDALETARQANLARTVFLRNMSHDIRTPMNAVIGFTNLALKAGENTKKIRDYLKKILVSSNHLLAIVNDVLEVSRIESGQTKLNETAEDMMEILEEVSVIIREQAQEKQQKFIVDISGVSDSYIYVDKLRIKQILVNLLGNAVKFTPRGGEISLTVLQIGTSEDGVVRLETHIKDNGCGMSPEFMKKMFIPFEREQTSTVSGVQGTGLGLPITKQFVELMHGSIKAVSEEGKGTEFVVRLNHRCAKDTILEEKSENPVQEDFSEMRILLAEDNGLNREIAVEVLKEYGFEIVEAENGKVAVEKLKDSPAGFFDAILMDIQMPVMDGYMATREIRALADPQIANIPIIALSANAFEEDKHASYVAGMDGHLAKPIDVSELIKVLGNILRKKGNVYE